MWSTAARDACERDGPTRRGQRRDGARPPRGAVALGGADVIYTDRSTPPAGGGPRFVPLKVQWSGAGSNRRPHDLQMDVSPFTAVHISVFLLVSSFSVFAPVRARSRQFIPVAAFVAASRRMATDGELLRWRTEPPARSPSASRVIVRSHAHRSRHSTGGGECHHPDTKLPSAPARSITYFSHSKVAVSPPSRDPP